MRFKKILAFACVYIIWGSTFLAIYYAIQKIPPFLMAGTRFVVGGIVLILFSLYKGKKIPAGKNLLFALITGLLLFYTGNGFLAWSEKYIPTGLASLIVATVPLWIVISGWIVYRRIDMTIETWVGIMIGFAGVGILSGADQLIFSGQLQLSDIQMLAVIVLVLASGSWGLGSVLSKKYPVSESITMGFGFQILFGGVFLIVTSFLSGESSNFNFYTLDWLSAGSLLYLIIFGTLIASTAYMWLIKVENPVIVGTYAYVNPLIAVVLGAAVLDEKADWRTWASFILILFAVFLVNRKSISDVLRNKKRPAG